MKKYFAIAISLIIMLGCSVTSCGTDDEPQPSNPSTGTHGTGSSSTSKVSRPSFDKFLTTTSTSTVSFRARFKTGGDTESNLSARVYWKSYSSKPSKTPKKSDLTKSESMRQYGAATYHNTGSKKGQTESIVFDRSHAGMSGGSYI